MKARYYWVWIVPAPKAPNSFEIALLPYRYHRVPKMKMKRLLFLSERQFPSDQSAKSEAEWLFGRLVWRPTSNGWKTVIKLSASPP